jgi:hypothetical protein
MERHLIMMTASRLGDGLTELPLTRWQGCLMPIPKATQVQKLI